MSIEFCNTCGEPPYEPIYLVGEVFCKKCLTKRVRRWRTIEAHAKALIKTGIDKHYSRFRKWGHPALIKRNQNTKLEIVSD